MFVISATLRFKNGKKDEKLVGFNEHPDFIYLSFKKATIFTEKDAAIKTLKKWRSRAELDLNFLPREVLEATDFKIKKVKVEVREV